MKLVYLFVVKNTFKTIEVENMFLLKEIKNDHFILFDRYVHTVISLTSYVLT